MLHVIMVPGADARPFDEDVAEAERRHFVPHPLPPLERKGHPIDGIRDYYEAVRAKIDARIAAIRAGEPDARFAGMGRNLGGSLVGYAAARGLQFDALALVGAIPDLSRFRQYSGHPGARAGRAALANESEIERFKETAPFDLVKSLRSMQPQGLLLQVGTRDDWMDPESFDIFRQLERRFSVAWVDDGHAMVSPAALAGRWDFLARSQNRKTVD